MIRHNYRSFLLKRFERCDGFNPPFNSNFSLKRRRALISIVRSEHCDAQTSEARGEEKNERSKKTRKRGAQTTRQRVQRTEERVEETTRY